MSTESINNSTSTRAAAAVISEHVESVQVSRVLRPNIDEEGFYKELTLGIEESLQAHPMIRDIKMIMRTPVSLPVITAWERKNNVKLPSDLKDYYSSTNGFKLTWNLDYAGDLLKIGEICVNSLNQLNPLEMGFTDTTTTGAPSAMSTSSTKEQWKFPTTGGASSSKTADAYLRISFEELQKMLETAKKNLKRSKIFNLTLGDKEKAFQLDSTHLELGTVCLVYPNGCHSGTEKSMTKPIIKRNNPNDDVLQSNPSETKNEPNVQIWFLDPSYQWHFLAPTFSHYYRMLLYHQGMPQWQYRFTPFGISAWAEQMFWLVTPHLLQPEKITSIPKVDHTIWSLDVPPEAACPNPTKNIINTSIFRKKKKDKKPQ